MIFSFIFSFILNLNALINYNLDVNINPYENKIEVDVEIDFGKQINSFSFYLNSNFDIDYRASGLSLIMDKKEDVYIKYLVRKKDFSNFRKVKFRYHGKINYPFLSSQEYQRSFSQTKGIISTDGCYLTRDSYFYPVIDDSMFKFKMSVKIDKEYKIITQGIREKEYIKDDNNISLWKTETPVYDISLICGKFSEYHKKINDIDFYVFLKNKDDMLSNKYIDYGKRYIDFYSKLIGKYPYKKFAIIENFWETGYAFPSFTLIGPSVIRFPFLFKSSYPHEILHNWWGNGVYVDYDKGNWCEGLSAYMADYLIQENYLKGRDYRIASLKKINDFINSEFDFPISEFKERHSPQSQAIGYDKTLMFFHMLRNKVGDKKFISAVRRFYKENLFKKASWRDLLLSFERESGLDLNYFFDEFINKIGISEIELSNVRLETTTTTYKISFSVEEKNGFKYDIPIRFYFSDGYVDKNIEINGKKEFNFSFDKKLYAMWLDPDYDVIRKLVDGELPPTLSKINGSKKVVIYLSSTSYNAFLDLYKGREDDYKIVSNTDFSKIEGDLFLVGDVRNILSLIDVKKYKINITSDSIFIDNIEYGFDSHSFILSFENPYFPFYSINFVISNNENIKKLAFKIPHYSKYSYVVFDNNLNNIRAGIWDYNNTPFLYYFDRIKKLDTKKTQPLEKFPYLLSDKRIKDHIKYLSKKLKTRHPGSKELDLAKQYIADEFKKHKIKPLFEMSYYQNFVMEISSKNYELSNVCGYIDNNSDRYLVISAHYDHLFPKENVFFPGASDNASGVSLMLELVNYFSDKYNTHSLVFCAFSGEEYQRYGSRYFINNLPVLLKDKIVANINIDTIGRLGNRKVLVLNSNSSKLWNAIFKNASYLSMVDYELSDAVLYSSDQISFIENKIPAVQIFDGGDLSYHSQNDIYDTIDFDGILRVGEFVIGTVETISKYSEIKFNDINIIIEDIKKRKISLGFMPDFSYYDKGVKIGRITKDSLLEKSPLKEGDIIIEINGVKIDNLITYSNLLSTIENDFKVKYISDNEAKEYIFKIQ